MNRITLVDRLIRVAHVRYGVTVTNVQFGDWLRENLIVTPTKEGQRRNWTRKQYRVSLEICRLKSKGVNFSGDIKWHLWIMGFSLPGFEPNKAQPKLLSAYKRQKDMALKRSYSTHDPTRETEISEQRKARITRSMGPGDERLKVAVAPSTNELFAGRSLFQFDVFAPELPGLLKSRIAGLAPDFTPELHGAVERICHGAALIGALMGNSDEVENSADDSIRMASHRHFDLARRAMPLVPNFFRCLGKLNPQMPMACSAVVQASREPQWRIGFYVALLHLVYRGDRANPNFSISFEAELHALEAVLILINQHIKRKL